MPRVIIATTTPKVPQIELEYQTFGNPAHPCILLISGLGTDLLGHPEETIVKPLVEQKYYVIRYDNRDIGKSSRLNQLGSPNLQKHILRTILIDILLPFLRKLAPLLGVISHFYKHNITSSSRLLRIIVKLRLVWFGFIISQLLKLDKKIVEYLVAREYERYTLTGMDVV